MDAFRNEIVKLMFVECNSVLDELERDISNAYSDLSLIQSSMSYSYALSPEGAAFKDSLDKMVEQIRRMSNFCAAIRTHDENMRYTVNSILKYVDARTMSRDQLPLHIEDEGMLGMVAKQRLEEGS